MTADAVEKTRRDLTEIIKLTATLPAQALTEGRSRLMPGGRAAVALGPVGSPDEWAELIAYEELQHLASCPKTDHRDCRYVEHASDESEEWPLQTLRYWSESWRTARGYSFDHPTLHTEASFLQSCVDWASDHEPRWDHFARDVRQVRVRLEDVLYAGRRMDRTRVECDRCAESPRLLQLLGAADDGTLDRWKCPHCKHIFDRDAMLRAHATQLRRESAAKHVDQADAIGTLRAQGRAERTIRKWLGPPLELKDRCTECGHTWPEREHASCPRVINRKTRERCGGELHPTYVGDPEAVVGGYCDLATHKTWVWWPDLWRLHLATQTRRRTSA